MNKDEKEKTNSTVVIQYGLEMTEERLPSMVREETYLSDTSSFTTPADVDKFFRQALRIDRKCEEYLYLLCLNNKGHVQGLFLLSKGSSNRTFCDMKAVGKRMLLAGSESVIVVHNHPSGNTEPSIEDDRVTERLSELASILDVKLLDMIIIGDDYFSYCEHHRM